jgi:phospholipid/cholesterol/gamma-HCH transport system substrate-binding protein
MSAKRIWLFVAAALLAGALSACGGSNGLEVKARFSDVGDLAPDAPVMMADVEIGKVDSISLDQRRELALVTMTIDPSARVPQDVVARVRRTSLLGERIVDLVVPNSTVRGAPLLQDGDVIRRTQVRPDLEDLVRRGTNVLAPIAASEVATMVNEGGRGFGGQGQALRTLLGNYRAILKAYAARGAEIESLIRNLNAFNGTLARHARAQGQALVNSARALGMLRAESGRLRAAIRSLDRLSVGARGILDAHSAQMGRFFAQMRVILGVLKSQQSSITGLLEWAPRHNRNTQLVDYQQFNQVLQDFVICGLNDDPSDPARRCKE